MTPTILIVEDEPTLRANLSRLLELEGFGVIAASDGTEGLDLARIRLPDLVICDMRMPGLTGDQVLAALRAAETTRNIPFFFLTASADHDARNAPDNNGADAYLVKPLDSQVLLDAVRACLDRRGNRTS